jgi:hypothetical protein
MKNSIKVFVLIVIAMILFTSCAHRIDVQACVEGTKVYGFWNGLWHGMIAGFTFIGSLFNHNIVVYAIHNNGAWYNLGFLLGVGGSFSGSTKGITYTRTNSVKYRRPKY